MNHPVIIYRSVHGLYHVHQGERYHDMLTWDEMLGQIVTLTHPQITSPRYPMLDADQWGVRRNLRAKPARYPLSTAPTLPPLEALQKMVHWHCRRDKDDKPLGLEFQEPEVQDAMRAIAAATESTT